MNILHQEKIVFAGAANKTFQFNNGLLGEVIPGILVIRTYGTTAVTVKGYADDSDTTGIALKFLDLANLAKTDSIAAAGDFACVVAGFEKVTVSVAGACTINVRITN